VVKDRTATHYWCLNLYIVPVYRCAIEYLNLGQKAENKKQDAHIQAHKTYAMQGKKKVGSKFVPIKAHPYKLKAGLIPDVTYSLYRQ
jgi:hypothetical protein